MESMLDRAGAWLSGRRHESLTRTVMYTRGATTVEMDVTRCRPNSPEIVTDDYVERLDEIDFKARLADFEQFGPPYTPEPGDRIRDTVHDKEYIYEVLATGGRKAWEYSGGDGTDVRLHTKLVLTG